MILSTEGGEEMIEHSKRKLFKWYIYLFYFLLISLIATGISFSRFSTVIVNSGPENIETPDIEFSTWIMDHEVANVTLEDMKPGDTKTISISVKNQDDEGRISGYNQSYTFEVVTTGNLPLQYSLSRQGAPVAFHRPNNYRYVSESQGFVANVSEIQVYILTISWPASSDYYTFKDEIDYIELQLRAVQS